VRDLLPDIGYCAGRTIRLTIGNANLHMHPRCAPLAQRNLAPCEEEVQSSYAPMLWMRFAFHFACTALALDYEYGRHEFETLRTGTFL